MKKKRNQKLSRNLNPLPMFSIQIASYSGTTHKDVSDVYAEARYGWKNTEDNGFPSIVEFIQ
jgi:hypothetical protein